MNKNTKKGNHIYSLRRNRGYLQKHVATLLGHRSPRMASRYENGSSLPPLRAAILLEIALGARLSEIYVDMYEELRADVLERVQRLPAPVRREIHGRLLGKDDNEHPGALGRVA